MATKEDEKVKRLAKAFKKLPTDFKEAVSNMGRDEIRVRLAQLTVELVELQEAEEEDEDLQEKKEAVKEASQTYVEGKKFFKLKSLYMAHALDMMGA